MADVLIFPNTFLKRLANKVLERNARKNETNLWRPEDLLNYVLEHKKNIDRIVIGYRTEGGDIEAVANTSDKTEVVALIKPILEKIDER